eukprot:TRINITY_DN10281_c0_g1_i4.p1 TRINITY_DN10281_c0_g1~~TRINITY_DN10281_c0_g1_i4.p1  ORF type:complete len:334 (-),score=35.56 TRINITY_DN10281_c0_g1_i4:86-1087(-)
MSWLSLLGYAVLAFVLIIVVCRLFFKYLVTPKLWFPEDKIYIDVPTGEVKQFPSLFEPATIDVSIIVPAYNEEKRIHPMLEDTLGYIQKRSQSDPSFTWEIIVVCDGCKDRTAELVRDYEKKRLDTNGGCGGEIRVLELTKNRGKGGAVRRGMMHGRGKALLMVDADGATKFSELALVENALNKILQDSEYGIAIGSRAHMQQGERKFHRKVLMVGFNILVSLFCISGIKDTQCGFKLFSRKTAQLLFPNLHVSRWAFDIDLLYMSQLHSIKVAEVPVIWEEIDGSTLDPLQAAIEMARDIVRIRLLHFLGVWSMIPNTIPRYTKELNNKKEA